MGEQLFQVQWSCLSCSREHAFRRVLGEFDDWPNKFEDLRCENPDCGQVQDVRTASCTITPIPV